MKHAEQHLCNAVMEKSAKKTVTERNRTQPVTMTETEPFSINFDEIWLLKALHAQFLEV